MKPKEFVAAYLNDALKAQSDTGISAVFTLAQSALESSWGKAAPGNMFFGIKDNDGLNGNEQLLITTEYSRRSNLQFPEIISITPVVRNGQKWFRYRIRDYFKKYNTPADSFIDHGNFFIRNSRYKDALLVKADPYKFAEEIAKAGYATDPSYSDTLNKMIKIIEKNIV